MKHILASSLLLLLPAWGLTQQKYEKEYRVEETEVPVEAAEFIKPMQFEKKVKWYYEENFAGNSYEAKFKDGGEKYSVEFDTLGRLQDIEVERAYKDLPKGVQDKMAAGLRKDYSKYRIRKVQLQYSGDIPNLYTFLASSRPAEDFTLRYEVVVKGRREHGWNLYEVTFSEEGSPLHTAEIVLRNTDNLEY